jgi:hypothetical protein
VLSKLETLVDVTKHCGLPWNPNAAREAFDWHQKPLRTRLDRFVAAKHLSRHERRDAGDIPACRRGLHAGWLYPECANYRPDSIRRLAEDAGFRFRQLDWRHPRQTWGLFYKQTFDDSWFAARPLTWNNWMDYGRR